ncbi:hypothetical protein LSAT2_021690 [Lamellibrachia satsuma]|nr:hypothetical protein LSAT2_021690 [Lamellibrachia satsuma]
MHGFIDSPRSFTLGLAADSSGRYPCKYPGCDKTFAQVCSAMRHERRCHQFWRSKTRNSGLSMMSDDFSSAMDTSKLGECYDDGGVNIATSAASALHEDEADDVSSPAPENIQGQDEATAGRCVPETRTGAHGTQPSSQEGARNWNLLD